MKHRTRFRQMLLAVATALGACSTQADFDAGLAAFHDKDYVKAAMEFTIDARKGDPRAQVNLGLLYENGLGVEPDPAEAMRLYESAAESGSVIAQVNLAAMHFEGAAGAPDYVQAAHWYQQAAIAGEPTAQYNLAVMYEEGLGVEFDLVQAWAWLQMAAAQDAYVSQRERDALKQKLTAGEVAEAEALYALYAQRYAEQQGLNNE